MIRVKIDLITIQRTGRVENFPRQSYSIWRLVFRALLSAFPEEKIKDD